MSFNLKGPIWMLILVSIMFENTLKMSHLANLKNIIICFLKEIRIWNYFSLTKIVKNRENRNDKWRTPSSHFSYFSQFSQFLQNFDTKKMRLLVGILNHCVLGLRGQNSLDHHYVKHPVFYCITAICPQLKLLSLCSNRNRSQFTV